MNKILLSCLYVVSVIVVNAQTRTATDLKTVIQSKTESLQGKTNSWREQIHQNPELGNREFKTAKLVAAHLRSLGIEVQEGVAKTGVVGLLKVQSRDPAWRCALTWMLCLSQNA